MKKILMVLGVAVLIAGLSTAAVAKKLIFINVDKGEMPNDITATCDVSVDEKYASTKNGLALKVEVKPDGENKDKISWWIGEFNPRKGIWAGYDYVRIDCFNPSKNTIPLEFSIKPVSGAGYSQSLINPLIARPGKSTLEISIAGATTMGGDAIDFTKKFKSWSLYQYNTGKAGTVLYFSNFRLETEGDEETTDKKSAK